MRKLVLYNRSVSNDNILLDSFDDDIILKNVEYTSIEELKDLSDNISNLGFLFHFEGYLDLGIFYEDEIDMSDNREIREYNYFSNVIIDLIRNYRDRLKLYYGLEYENNKLIVDLLTCDINRSDYIECINRIEEDLNIIIRYSINSKGNKPEADWVMESHNIDIRDIYFSDNILLWEDRLTNGIEGDDILDLSDNSGNLITKIIEGDKTIYSLNRDFNIFESNLDLDISNNRLNSFIRLKENEIFDGNNNKIFLGSILINGLFGFDVLSSDTTSGLNDQDRLNKITSKDINLNNEYAIVRNLEIVGNSSSTNLNGERRGFIVLQSQRYLVIDNCKVSGRTSSRSGGIIGQASNLFIINNCECTFTRMPSFFGGGITSISCSNFIIENSSVSLINANTGNHVGGVCGDNNLFFYINNCNTRVNINFNGGGISSSNCRNFLIENCYSENLIGTAGVSGGIIGTGSRVGTIINCYSKGIITNSSGSFTYPGSGGITGPDCRELVIKNCYSTGNIRSRFGGGILGRDNYNIVIENCYSTGDFVSFVTTDSTIFGRGSNESGGICGVRCYNIEMRNCYALGNMITYGDISTDPLFNLYGRGGILANGSRNCIIENCYYLGIIIGNNHSYTGGITGGICENMIIRNCYSIISRDNIETLGGIVSGIRGDCIIQNSYSNIIFTGLIGRDNIDEIVDCNLLIQNSYTLDDNLVNYNFYDVSGNIDSEIVIQNSYSTLGDLSNNENDYYIIDTSNIVQNIDENILLKGNYDSNLLLSSIDGNLNSISIYKTIENEGDKFIEDTIYPKLYPKLVDMEYNGPQFNFSNKNYISLEEMFEELFEDLSNIFVDINEMKTSLEYSINKASLNGINLDELDFINYELDGNLREIYRLNNNIIFRNITNNLDYIIIGNNQIFDGSNNSISLEGLKTKGIFKIENNVNVNNIIIKNVGVLNGEIDISGGSIIYEGSEYFSLDNCYYLGDKKGLRPGNEGKIINIDSGGLCGSNINNYLINRCYSEAFIGENGGGLLGSNNLSNINGIIERSFIVGDSNGEVIQSGGDFKGIIRRSFSVINDNYSLYK